MASQARQAEINRATDGGNLTAGTLRVAPWMLAERMMKKGVRMILERESEKEVH